LVREPRLLDGFDLTDLDNFARGFPHDMFAEHRREAPVFLHAGTEHTPDGEPFWSVATYAESLAVMRDPQTYSSETGGARPYGGTLLADMPISGSILNMMDEPRHGRIRRLVSKGLTPKTILRVEADLRRRTRALLDIAAQKEEVDFVTEVAAELPMQMISLLLGVPEEDRHFVFERLEPSFDLKGDVAYEVTADSARAGAELFEYGAKLVAGKRAHPTDDMLSIVVHAEMPDEDPPRLTDDELHLFFSLLFAGGSETTRNATAGGLLALMQHPEEQARLRRDRTLTPFAIEEIVRWTSPASHQRRTATREVDLAGHAISPGDKVVFWEASANRDDAAFGDGMRFDVARDPNPHLGFGHGVHFCLGASLAQLEIRVMLEELLDRFESIELNGEPEWTRSFKHTGLRHLPVRMR
jgi:cytochrome P450